MKDKLYAQIQELHDLIEEKAIDASASENIKRVSEEVQIALQSGNTDVNRAFGDELEQEALQFEEKHPTISQIIKEIINTLHSVGI